MVNDIVESVTDFLRKSRSRQAHFFNEAELQHELGYWLRKKLALTYCVYFERPAHSFFPNAQRLANQEIDLVVARTDGSQHFAIELKCPRNGAIPDTLFKAVGDLKRLELLVAAGSF